MGLRRWHTSLPECPLGCQCFETLQVSVPTGMPAGIAPVASAPAGPNTHRPSPSRPFPACAVSICPSICLSVHLPVRLSACPSICLPGLLEWRVCEEWPQPAVCSQVRLPLVRGEGRGVEKRGKGRMVGEVGAETCMHAQRRIARVSVEACSCTSLSSGALNSILSFSLPPTPPSLCGVHCRFEGDG